MRPPLAILLSCAALAAPTASASEISEYVAKLDSGMAFVKQAGDLKTTVRPRLLERAFALHVEQELSKGKSRKDILLSWIPIQRALVGQGFVFQIEFLLTEQNLDSAIEIPFTRDFRRSVSLVNNLGDTALCYKVESDAIASLNFLYPKKTVTCYFNTQAGPGVPLLRRTVDSLTLNIAPLNDQMQPLGLKIGLPLWYDDVKRPKTLESRFTAKPLRTFLAYTNIYLKPALAPAVPAGAPGPAGKNAGKAAAPKLEKPEPKKQ